MTYAGSNSKVTKLEHYFRHRPIARLDELRRTLHVSGRTVFRILGRMGYLCSCSHAGKYYTLVRTPSFDADGLWVHSDVLFSRHRTLRDTIVHLVSKAPAGHIHAELQDRLQLRVYDTLHDLVTAREIGRAEIEKLYLYVSVEPTTAEIQIAARQRLLAEPAPAPAPLPDATVVIEVLLAVIHAPKPDLAAVAALLRAQGKAITPGQVEAVWDHYQLGKKKPALRRSRR